MDTASILILQGGGALGAYECGVYTVLAPYLENLIVVAGTSIGAINASIIASHYKTDDRGVGCLEDFWNKDLGNLSRGVFFPETDTWRRWNAVWTSLLCGHPRFFTPEFFGWTFWAPVAWSSTHFYNMEVMEDTLRQKFGSYGPRAANPRLIVTTVDIEMGELHAFDSWKDCVTAAHVIASGSLPPSFPAKVVDGRSYWDGGLWSNTPLPEVLRVLREQPGPDGEPPRSCKIYVVDVFPQKGLVPQTNWEVWHRMTQITYADKTRYETKFCELVNAYTDLVEALQQHAAQLPESVAAKIEKASKQLGRNKWGHISVMRFQRKAFPDERAEGISREIDFSPNRITELITQGKKDAQVILANRPRS